MPENSFDVAAALNDRDVDLVMDFVVGELSAEGVEQLRGRIDRDPAFRRLAENIVAAWQIPLIADEPVDRAQLMRSWDEFTRRAGFTHQKRRARIRWITMSALVLLAIGVTGFAARSSLTRWYEDRRDFATVNAIPGEWFTLLDGTQVLVEPGAKLRGHREVLGKHGYLVKLTGGAHFRIVPKDTDPLLPAVQPFAVHTRAGVVASMRGDFAVRARGDTTLVEVLPPASRAKVSFILLPTIVFLEAPHEPNPVLLRDGQRGRLVSNKPTERLP